MGRLAADQQSCIAWEEYLVYSDLGTLTGIRPILDFTGTPFSASGVTVNSITGMDFDGRNNRIIYSVNGPRPALRWINVKNTNDNGTIIFKSDNFTTFLLRHFCHSRKE